MQGDITYLTIQDIMHRLKVSDQTVRRWIKSGRLPAIDLGGQYRIDPRDFEEFLKKRRTPPPKENNHAE